MQNNQVILKFIDLISDDSKEWYYSLYTFLITHLPNAVGSIYEKHQRREWWYYDHIAEMLLLWERLYLEMNQFKKLQFNFESVIKIVLLHDIEKPFNYTNDWKEIMKKWKLNNQSIFAYITHKYYIKLNDDELNWIRYIHWEGNDYSEKERIMKPLAAFCHILDVASARIYYDRF